MTGIYISPEPPPSTTNVVIVSRPEEAPNVGELLVLRFRGRKGGEKDHLYEALGIVTRSAFLSKEPIPTIHPQSLERLNPSDGYVQSSVYILGEIVKRGDHYTIEPLVQAPYPGSFTEVKIADEEDIKKLLSIERDYKYINLGSHLGTGIDVYVSLEEIATKHLAILAITGAGKSNTVGHLIREISTGKASLPVIVFDMHGEYDLRLSADKYIRETPKFDPYDLEAEDYYPLIGLGEQAIHERNIFYEALESAKHLVDLYYEILHAKYSVSKPRGKNFIALLTGTLAAIALDAADNYDKKNKERKRNRLITLLSRISRKKAMELGKDFIFYFDLAFNLTYMKLSNSSATPIKDRRFTVVPLLGRDENYIRDRFDGEEEELASLLARIAQKLNEPAYIYENPSKDINRIMNIMRKFFAFAKRYKEYISRSDLLEDYYGMKDVIVLDLSGLSMEEADILVSFYMSKMFRIAKSAFGRDNSVKALMILEEAHNFIGDRTYTKTRLIAEKIMREGRKYGVGLVVVSQRPRRLDSNIMSQVNNYIILRIVHPEDQNYVGSLTETLPQELARSLSSLRTGEALIVGPFTPIPIPLFVKIRDASDFKHRGQSARIKKNSIEDEFDVLRRVKLVRAFFY